MDHEVLSLTTEQLQQIFLHTTSEGAELFTADEGKELKSNSISAGVWAWNSVKVTVQIFDS